ncbi:MAG TPA: hypothetical protein VFI19_09065 [Nocardioides sp.]|jgi:hypothetical protein|nr:hypothetical protein [Nocardioides sp.]
MAGQNPERDPKHHVLVVLLEKIEQDPFPSTSHLDIAEQLLTPETTPIYIGLLLDKIKGDPFPSSDHIKRVLSLSG